MGEIMQAIILAQTIHEAVAAGRQITFDSVKGDFRVTIVEDAKNIQTCAMVTSHAKTVPDAMADAYKEFVKITNTGANNDPN